MAWLLLLSPALLPGAARSRHIVACLPDRTAASAADTWEAMFERLVEYQSEWGSADAVLGTDLGRWCTTQRRLRSNGLLSDSKVQRLEELGMSWKAPTDIVPTESDWAEMCRRLAAYRAEQGDAQVPKKLKKKQPIVDYLHKARTRPAKKPLGEISNLQTTAVR